MLANQMSVDEAATYVALLLALAGFLCAPWGTLKQYFRFQKADFAKTGLGAGLLATLAVIGTRYLLQFSAVILSGEASRIPPDFSATDFTPMQCFLICLQSPLFEELTFRGYSLELFQRFGLRRLGIFVSCLLFALSHFSRYGLTATGSAFLFGGVLCSVTIRHRSLLGPLVIHVLHNVYVFTVNWIGTTFLASIAENPRSIILVNVAFAMVGLSFVLVGWKSLQRMLFSLR